MRDSAVTGRRPWCSGPAGGEGQQMKIFKCRWWLAAAAAVLVAVSAVLTTVGAGGGNAAPARATAARAGGVGPLTGPLPPEKVTQGSAPPGEPNKETGPPPPVPGT